MAACVAFDDGLIYECWIGNSVLLLLIYAYFGCHIHYFGGAFRDLLFFLGELVVDVADLFVD